jgi:hypothetical protein
MRHIKIFETFNSQKSPVCQIEFTTCIPYNCDDFTGNWTIEKHHILVDVEVPGVDATTAAFGKELFDFDLDDYILPSIQKGKFRLDGYSDDIVAIDNFFENPKKIMAMAKKCQYLENFLGDVHEELYEIVVKSYRKSCRGKYINTDGVSEVMEKPKYSWL